MISRTNFTSKIGAATLLAFILLLPNWLNAQSYKDSVFTNYFRLNPPGWIASDGALSTLLPDGRTMWMMGDSHIDQEVNSNGEIPCLFNARNSILIQD